MVAPCSYFNTWYYQVLEISYLVLPGIRNLKPGALTDPHAAAMRGNARLANMPLHQQAGANSAQAPQHAALHPRIPAPQTGGKNAV